MPSSAPSTSSSFQSFPIAFKDEDEPIVSTLQSKIKRLFSPTSVAETVTPIYIPDPFPAPPPSISSNASTSASTSAGGAIPPSSSSDNIPSTSLTAASTPSSSQLQPVASTSSLLPAKDTAKRLPAKRPATDDFPILPNGRRVGARPLRLSNVAPSVRLTVTHAETTLKGSGVVDLSRSIASDYSRSSDVITSPTTNDGFSASLAANFSTIPGFPLSRDVGDDSKSVRSVSTVGGGGGGGAAQNSASVAQVFRRLRGEGLSKDYWIRDESSRECFDCQTVFTAFRRKHHCRICGQIFCSRCASNIISSARFGSRGFVRVCNLCLSIMEESTSLPADEQAPASRFRSGLRESTTLTISAPLEASARPPQSQFAASHLFPRSAGNNPGIGIESPYYHLPPESNYGGRSRAMSDVSSRPGTPLDFFDGDGAGGGGAAEKRRSYGSPLGEFASNRLHELQMRGKGVGGGKIGGGSSGGIPGSGPASPPLAVAPFRRELAEEDKVIEGIDAGEGMDGLGITENEEIGDEMELDDEENGEDVIEEEDEDGEGKRPSLAVDTTEKLPSNSKTTSPVVPPPKSFNAPHSDSGHPTSVALRGSTSSKQESEFAFSSILPPAPFAQTTPERSHLNLDNSYFFSNHTLPSPGPSGLLKPTLTHLRKMLRQTLDRAKIPNSATWENELMRLFLKVIARVAPNVRAGDSIDVRKYIHVKKVPGGRPQDSEFVAGFVFTKNVLHKQMSRLLHNPRIMLLSFSLEYQRVENQLMSLEPLLKQEREYLQNLVARIARERPHIILVERNVSRLALDYLMEANIAVARNVKPEVIAAVARATSAGVVKSMDQITSARIGRCGTFRIQTFVHSLIPGKRKSLMRFEGCNEELGSTLILRGDSMEVLEKIKKIVDVMILVAYSAKLEGHLIRDELVVPLPPNSSDHDHEYSPFDDTLALREGNDQPILPNLLLKENERTSKAIADSLAPYTHTVLAASPWIKFSAPYPIASMSAEDERVVALRRQRELEETAEILHAEYAASKESSSLAAAHSANSSTFSLSSLAAFSEYGGSTSASVYDHNPRQHDHLHPLSILQTEADVARKHEFVAAERHHAESLELWQAYIDQCVDSLDPVTHQKLYVLESLGCDQTDKLCRPPALRCMEFYGHNDVTIGQLMDSVADSGGTRCETLTCGRTRMSHYRTFVHGNYRITLSTEVYRIDLHIDFAKNDDQAVMWSFCKLCNLQSAQAIMSEETRRLSFGKYLEMCFYPDSLVRFDGLCGHNAHSEHVRYWGYRNTCFQITPELIDVRNFIPPPLQLVTRPEKHLQLRNEEYEVVLRKSTAFWDSVARRIYSFNYDLVAADKLEEARTAMEELKVKCELDRAAIKRGLEKTYVEAQETNNTELTNVRRALQNKAVEWEGEFAAFEQRIFPADRDVRRLTTVQIRRLFIDAALPLSPERKTGPASSNLSPSIELEEKLDEKPEPSDLSISPTESTLAKLVTSQNLALFASEFTSSSSNLSAPSVTSTDATSLPSPALSTESMPEPFTADPTSSSPILMQHSTDNESDSTVCADGSSSRRVSKSPFLNKLSNHIPEDTSGAESDGEGDMFTPRRHPPAGGVAELIKRFGDEGDDGKRLLPVVPRPYLRRGQTDRPRPSKRMVPDILSDGDGGSYARNVGVHHLSNRSFLTEHPSRIPTRKAVGGPQALDKTFDADHQHLAEPSISRSASRSGRSTPALQRHDSAENSAITVRTGRPPLSKSHTSTRSIKGKGVANAWTSGEESSSKWGPTTRGSHSRSSSKDVKDLGIARPTTSSSNKATARRASSHSGTSSHVTAITKHFNKITREADRERQRRLALVRNKRARPVAIAHPTVQVFDNVKDAVKEDSESDSSMSSDADDEDDGEDGYGKPDPHDDEGIRNPIVETVPNVECSAAPVDSSLIDPTVSSASEPAPDVVVTCGDTSQKLEAPDPFAPSVPPSPRFESHTMPRMSEGESSGNERGSTIIKAISNLSNLFNYRGGDFTPLEYPLNASEHLFKENPILIREDEPSSIVAFALSSPEYRAKLREHDSARVVERSEVFMPDEVHHPNEKSGTWGILELQDGEDVEETLRKPEAKHFRLQYEEGSTKFSCKLFYAEQFDALRRNCGCSSQFTESLARCFKWENTGGKSKADFLKTRDERFILKEISRLEMDALLRFAPAYFDYMSKAFFHGLPTILAKIYGFYRISLRNPSTGASVRVDVLVMENLFYDRKLAKVFDLKGSTRNRHVPESKDRPNEVLMDENLIEMSHKNPLYVREGSRRFLKAAIFNDSLFLSSANVMDYSLVVGIDSVKGELVVGIVDFIRTYTWDKRLESWVKDTALLGGGSSKPGGPTIVTPRQYKNRFRTACDTYFLLAPDPWLSLEPVTPPTVAASSSADAPVKEEYISKVPGLNLPLSGSAGPVKKQE